MDEDIPYELLVRPANDDLLQPSSLLANAMSKYQYLAYLTEIAIEIAQAKNVPADEIFKTLASLPREKVAEHVKKMI
jgi:hypothetical protein